MSLSNTLNEAEAIFVHGAEPADAKRVLGALRERHAMMVERDAADRLTHQRVHGGGANPHAERDGTRQTETLLMGRYVEAFASRVAPLVG